MYWLTLSNFARSCPRIAAYLEDSEKRFVDLRAPGGHTHWPEVYSETIHLSCPQLSVPHLILPGLNQGLSGFLPSSSPFAGSRKGEATAV